MNGIVAVSICKISVFSHPVWFVVWFCSVAIAIYCSLPDIFNVFFFRWIVAQKNASKPKEGLFNRWSCTRCPFRCVERQFDLQGFVDKPPLY